MYSTYLFDLLLYRRQRYFFLLNSYDLVFNYFLFVYGYTINVNKSIECIKEQKVFGNPNFKDKKNDLIVFLKKFPLQ